MTDRPPLADRSYPPDGRPSDRPTTGGRPSRPGGPLGPPSGETPAVDQAQDQRRGRRPTGPDTRGSGQDGLRLAPPTSSRRRRLPELILGIFLIAVCALAAVLIAISGRERDEVLAVSSDIERGSEITDDDLTTTQVGTDGDVTYVSPSDRDTLVGRVALTDLESGTLVTPDMLGDPIEVLDDDGLVGFVASAEELPMLVPSAGDVVNVIASPQGATGEGEFIAQAQIVEITPVEDTNRREELWHISLRAPETQADRLGMALIGQAQIKLVLVGE